MLIVDVDMVGSQALQRGFTGRTDILRASADAGYGRPASIACRGAAHDAELGGNDEFVALSLDPTPDLLFVGECPLHVGGIEKVYPKLDGTVECCH